MDPCNQTASMAGPTLGSPCGRPGPIMGEAQLRSDWLWRAPGRLLLGAFPHRATFNEFQWRVSEDYSGLPYLSWLSTGVQLSGPSRRLPQCTPPES